MPDIKMYRTVVTLPVSIRDHAKRHGATLSGIMQAALAAYLDLDPVTWEKKGATTPAPAKQKLDSKGRRMKPERVERGDVWYDSTYGLWKAAIESADQQAPYAIVAFETEAEAKAAVARGDVAPDFNAPISNALDSSPAPRAPAPSITTTAAQRPIRMDEEGYYCWTTDDGRLMREDSMEDAKLEVARYEAGRAAKPVAPVDCDFDDIDFDVDESELK